MDRDDVRRVPVRRPRSQRCPHRQQEPQRGERERQCGDRCIGEGEPHEGEGRGLLPAGGLVGSDRPIAALRGRSIRSQQHLRGCGEVLLLPEGRGLVPLPEPDWRDRRPEAARGLGAERQPTALRAKVHQCVRRRERRGEPGAGFERYARCFGHHP